MIICPLVKRLRKCIRRPLLRHVKVQMVRLVVRVRDGGVQGSTVAVVESRVIVAPGTRYCRFRTHDMCTIKWCVVPAVVCCPVTTVRGAP